MVFAGTIVMNGSCICIVVNTGMHVHRNWNLDYQSDVCVRILHIGRKNHSCRVFGVEGTTYDPKDGLIMEWNRYNMDATLLLMLKYVQSAMMLGSSVMVVTRVFKAIGLPTEATLKVFVEKIGVPDGKARSK
ncbi:Calcium-transporting ATPase, endoplasmic reticulum-type [Capsicum baccatum]|uniref:Calcium-transporting ATPase, endoplasmic reticulum-type n=1 Tax=Capsicum baccatum TaxID=33114 RepID=A0A2G2V5N6_CAPBA|nr:Calcium-transporting ATPase, endoplasmic reticulum-type [Capsicum baccatum]